MGAKRETGAHPTVGRRVMHGPPLSPSSRRMSQPHRCLRGAPPSHKERRDEGVERARAAFPHTYVPRSDLPKSDYIIPTTDKRVASDDCR